MVNTKLISTSALSKQLNIQKQELDTILINIGWVLKEEGKLQLTDSGKEMGATYLESKRFGIYIGWPDDIKLPSSIPVNQMLKAFDIAKQFNLSARRINLILSELGWIERYLKGWKVTASGLKIGAVQKENSQSGIPFAEWPKELLENKTFLLSIQELKGDTAPEPKEEDTQHKEASNDFRTKFEAKFRSTDGHFVRSKAEMLIDNWLYMAEIVHAYERKLPIEEDVYCDFYIPTGKVYIEYWGYENEAKYLARKKVKQEIYKKYDFKLIELNDDDVQNLDDVLPRLLLKHGVQSY